MSLSDSDLLLSTQALIYRADIVYASDSSISSQFRDLAVLVLNKPSALSTGQLNNVCIALSQFISSSVIEPSDIPSARSLLKRFRSIIPPDRRNYK